MSEYIRTFEIEGCGFASAKVLCIGGVLVSADTSQWAFRVYLESCSSIQAFNYPDRESALAAQRKAVEAWRLSCR